MYLKKYDFSKQRPISAFNHFIWIFLLDFLSSETGEIFLTANILYYCILELNIYSQLICYIIINKIKCQRWSGQVFIFLFKKLQFLNFEPSPIVKKKWSRSVYNYYYDKIKILQNIKILQFTLRNILHFGGIIFGNKYDKWKLHKVDVLGSFCIHTVTCI